MITSTYGVKIGEDGDQGPIVFPALNTNATILRDHHHTGADSAKVLASDLTKGTVSLSNASWVATGTSNGWKQTVTCPGAHTLASSVFRVRISSGAGQDEVIYPTIVRQSATTFDVVVNDNSLNLQISFL